MNFDSKLEASCSQNIDHLMISASTPKSTISRLLSGKRVGFRLITLCKIASGLNKRLVIRLE